MLGWLDSYHTFNFSSHYMGRDYDGYESLRVINEDTVAPGEGFPPHPHANFEIFSYVLSGAITHQDSMGHTERLPRGSVQFTHAGRGIMHSEFNREPREDLKFLQIWVRPLDKNTEPRYETRHWSDDDKRNRWVLLVSPNPRQEQEQEEEVVGGKQKAILVMADMRAWATLLMGADALVSKKAVGTQKKGYLHVAMTSTSGVHLSATSTTGGAVEMALKPGDGVYVDAFDHLDLRLLQHDASAEILFFEF
jgi:uncharacterized cupin superfamily protein